MSSTARVPPFDGEFYTFGFSREGGQLLSALSCAFYEFVAREDGSGSMRLDKECNATSKEN